MRLSSSRSACFSRWSSVGRSVGPVNCPRKSRKTRGPKVRLTRYRIVSLSCWRSCNCSWLFVRCFVISHFNIRPNWKDLDGICYCCCWCWPSLACFSRQSARFNQYQCQWINKKGQFWPWRWRESLATSYWRKMPAKSVCKDGSVLASCPFWYHRCCCRFRLEIFLFFVWFLCYTVDSVCVVCVGDARTEGVKQLID